MQVTDMMGRLERDTAQLRLRLSGLTRQIASGQRAEGFGDIAPSVPRALDLKAEIARRDSYGQAIGEAQQCAAASQSVLSRLIAIGREFGEQVAMKLDPDHPEDLAPVAERARQALVEVGQLLNSRHAGEYLFGGSDFANPPIPDPEKLPTGGMAAQVRAAVAALGGGNAAAVAAATKAAAQDDSAGVTPFSAFLVDPAQGMAEARRAVPAEDGVMVSYGLFASRNASAASTGETAGGWARDLMRGLMSLAALTPAQTADKQDFRDFAATIRDGLRSATAALGAEAGAPRADADRHALAAGRHPGGGPGRDAVAAAADPDPAAGQLRRHRAGRQPHARAVPALSAARRGGTRWRRRGRGPRFTRS
jgi:flagellin-like hook-associated protein FlgL